MEEQNRVSSPIRSLVGNGPVVLTLILLFGVLSLALMTASLRSQAVQNGRQSETAFRKKTALEACLGQIRGEVRRLKAPTAIKARLQAMRQVEKSRTHQNRSKKRIYSYRP